MHKNWFQVRIVADGLIYPSTLSTFQGGISECMALVHGVPAQLGDNWGVIFRLQQYYSLCCAAGLTCPLPFQVGSGSAEMASGCSSARAPPST